MREFLTEDNVKKVMKKLFKKDRKTYDILTEKINEVLTCEDVNHYKNLRKPLQYLKRVHIHGPFILTFKYIEAEDKVIFYDYDHHDNIYK